MPRGLLTTVRGSVVATAATPVVALRNNPDRVGLILCNLGTEPIFITPLGEGNPAQSIQLPVAYGPMILSIDFMGQLVTSGVLATSPAGASSLGVTEVILVE